MNDTERYNLIHMDITLMRRGYSIDDLDVLFTDPFSTLYPTRVGFQWQPTAVGEDMIEIAVALSFVLGSVSKTLLDCMVTDFYEWGKSSLRKVLTKKQSFEESRIHLKFKDLDVTIYSNNMEEICAVFEHFDVVYDYLDKNAEDNKRIELMTSDIVELDNIIRNQLP